MKSFNKVFNENDELYTPSCLVSILKPFIPSVMHTQDGSRTTRVWCPFDNKHSEYVKILSDDYDVVFGDLNTGNSFFACGYPDYDIVISNPPFSLKYSIFKRLFAIGKPFAILMNLMALNYQEIGELFYEVSVTSGEAPQMIIPDKKVSFNGRTSSFCSGYVTWKLLSRTEYVHLDNNNTGKYFIPAESYCL